MWYFAKDGQQQGPVSEEQLRSMARDGSLRREDLVWQEGMPAWTPAGEVPGFVFGAGVSVGLPEEMPTMPIQTVPPPPPPAPVGAPPAPVHYDIQTPPITGPGAGAPYTPPMAHPGMGGGADIPNYLAGAILVTLLCCLPTGIVSILYASKANSAKAIGDYDGARRAAATAKTWMIVSVVASLLVIVLYIVLIGVGGVMSAIESQSQ